MEGGRSAMNGLYSSIIKSIQIIVAVAILRIGDWLSNEVLHLEFWLEVALTEALPIIAIILMGVIGQWRPKLIIEYREVIQKQTYDQKNIQWHDSRERRQSLQIERRFETPTKISEIILWIHKKINAQYYLNFTCTAEEQLKVIGEGVRKFPQINGQNKFLIKDDEDMRFVNVSQIFDFELPRSRTTETIGIQVGAEIQRNGGDPKFNWILKIASINIISSVESISFHTSN